jgi:Virulence-associated protein E/Toprim domain
MNAAEIAAKLGKARLEGRDWRTDCPVCTGHNLTLSDGKTRLLVTCFNGCKAEEVLAELRQRGLYGPNGAQTNGASHHHPETRAEHEARAQSATAKRQARRANALDMLRDSVPADDTMAATYLASRLLLGPIPAALRWVPSIWHKEAAAGFPALVGLVEHTELGAVGIHAIFLNPLDATSRLSIEPRKKSFGPVKGGAVRLAPAGPVIALAEGIEDALTFMQATGTPSWAAITAPGMRSFVPPPRSETATIILIEDSDENQTGQKAVAETARRLAKAGYEIKIAGPVAGFKDLNEALLKLGLHDPIFTITDYQPKADWQSKCLTTADGRTLCNLANALLALREDPVWAGAFAYDGMLSRPIHQTGAGCLPIADHDITEIQEQLQTRGLPTVGWDTVYRAVDLVARQNTFHPVKDYLESLVWDGTERLEDWLTDCFGVEKTEYAMAVGKMFPIGMVARIYQPGCQADYMLILEGSQGIQKSSACRALAGEWFSDNMPENVASKDAALHMSGKWLVEISELHAFSKSETSALKAFLTRREDIYRPHFGRKEEYRPRQNLFVGTTNKQTYLQDPTGGRRFWPVRTTEIDVELLALQRDQLFAEAVVRYRRGEQWWPDLQFEADHIKPEQETRFDEDAWEEPIAEHLSRLSSTNNKVTVFGLAKAALNFETARVGTADRNRITAILEHLGWERAPRGDAKGSRLWVKSASVPKPQDLSQF